jgi:peptidoglycan/xylan/chitin deacetylase (PgdA/CDA1 family)
LPSTQDVTRATKLSAMPNRPRKASGLARLALLAAGATVVVGGAYWIDATRSSNDDAALGQDKLIGKSATTTAPTTTTTTTTPPVTLQPLTTDDNGAPVITRVETTDPVVFLTIDDGLTRTPEGLAEFQRLGMPASLFLINQPVEEDSGWFAQLPHTLVESHTQSHANLKKLSEAQQQEEICGNADRIEAYYGRRPVLFRPPFGNWNDATKRAAAACGMRAVVLWQENVNFDVVGFREVQYFRPGDIILMHFRPSFIQELNVIKQRVEEQGLRFAFLEDYLAPDSIPPGFQHAPQAAAKK